MQNFIMRPGRAFLSGIILLAFIGLAGCSTLRLGYANGDSIAYWWMNSYVGFSDQQRPWVRDELGKFFAWHRQTQLPDYAQVLARAQQRLQQPVNAAEVQEDFTLMRERAERIVAYALPSLTTLALSLSPQQIANIERKLAANNEKYRKEYLRGGPGERRQARFEKLMKQAGYWFGDFNAAQTERIRTASNARPLDYELRMAERLRRQGELVGMLRKIQAERPSRAATSAMLHAYARRILENFSYTDRQPVVDASGEGMAELVAQIVNMANATQKAHATRRLQKLIDDGYALAGVRPSQQLSMQADQ
jgi:hypothetical protein